MLCLKIARWLANSVDPDEMPCSVASIWVYTVCSGPSVQIYKGWLGEAKFSCRFCHRFTGASKWYWLTAEQGLLSLQQVRVERECCYFFCSFTFFHFPLSSLSLSFIFSSIASISFLPFSGEDTKWPTMKPPDHLWAKFLSEYLGFIMVLALCHVDYHIYPKFWGTLTLYHTCPNIWKSHFITCWWVWNNAAQEANSADHDQMLHLWYLIRVYTVCLGWYIPVLSFVMVGASCCLSGGQFSFS